MTLNELLSLPDDELREIEAELVQHNIDVHGLCDLKADFVRCTEVLPVDKRYYTYCDAIRRASI